MLRRSSSASGTPLILAIAAGAWASACRLSVPPELAKSSDVLLVEDRAFAPGAFGTREDFRLGGRQVSQVERQSFGFGLSVGGVSSESASGGYSFQIDGQRGPLQGRCVTSEAGFEAQLTSVLSLDSRKSNLVCECGASAQLSLADGDFSDYSGKLQVEGRSYEISTVYEALFPAGYTVSGKNPVAMLDNMNPGQRVWIARSWETEHRDELSCLFASLLLYQPPTESAR